MRFNVLLLIATPIAVVALAVWMDTRLGRGYGLALLAAGILALDVFGIIAFSQAAQHASATHTDNLEVGFVELVYFAIGLILALALALGGVAETIIARQWRWLAIIVVGAIVPAVLIIAPWTALVPDVLGALGLSRGGESVVLTVLPVLVIFAYAIDCIRRSGRAMKPEPADSR